MEETCLIRFREFALKDLLREFHDDLRKRPLEFVHHLRALCFQLFPPSFKHLIGFALGRRKHLAVRSLCLLFGLLQKDFLALFYLLYAPVTSPPV